MSAPAWEDLDLFFNEDEFATPATFTLSDESTVVVSVILDGPYRQAVLRATEIDTSDTVLTLPASRVPAGLSRGNRCDVDGRAFRVGTIEPTGTGTTVIRLTEGAP